MARQRSWVNSALRPSHLQAIGKVAATWSSLEAQIFASISTFSEVQFMKVVTMCAPLAFHATTDVLMRFARANEDHAEKEKDLAKHCEHIKTLYSQRNNVVHALWLSHKPGLAGLLGVLGPPPDIAKGIGVPKKGRKIMIPVNMTASQIREVAKQIAKAERDLHELTHRQTPTSKRKALARALMAAPSPQTSPATP